MSFVTDFIYFAVSFEYFKLTGRLAIAAENNFLVAVKVTLFDVVYYLFGSRLMFKPQWVRAISTVAVVTNTECAVAWTLVCDVEIKLIAYLIRNIHSFYHYNYLFFVIYQSIRADRRPKVAPTEKSSPQAIP